MRPKRVVFLMSDTGAGHRAAANAIRAGLEWRYPGEYLCELVDVCRRYMPFPYKYLPELYPRWVNWGRRSWGLTYRLADAPDRSRQVMAVLARLWSQGLGRMLVEHPGDVFVCVHGLFPRPAMRALRAQPGPRPPFVTVITDLVTAHAFWYEPAVDRCLVPTPEAYARGLAHGLSPAQLRLTGPPVHPRFLNGLPGKDEARRALGLHPALPAVVLVGGGDGMGPVYRIARALNERRLEMQLVVVAGRNRALQRRLEKVPWLQPTLVTPFVYTMPDLMAAADILVTKAGPATIGEACAAGLPVVLSGAVPGQEDGNVAFVLRHQLGTYAPGPRAVADTVAAWLAEGEAGLARRSAAVRQFGPPDAVWTIADEIHQQAAGCSQPVAQPLQSRR
jgi:1,2-diacylglycerol 3-beta-galactosyltransferase